MRTAAWIVMVIVALALATGGEALAGKGGNGGGGGKPGDGGDEEPTAGNPAIAFLRNSDYQGSGAGELWVMDADGANETKLLDHATALPPAWSPDGTAIAFGGDYAAPEGDGIYVMRLQADGTWVGPTKIVDTWDQTFQIDWSPTAPNGQQYLAFEAFVDRDGNGYSDDTDIFLLAVDLGGPVPVVHSDGSGDAIRLTNTPGHRERHPAFSRDGTRLAYTSNSVEGEFESAHDLVVIEFSFTSGAPEVLSQANLTAASGGPLDERDLRQPCWGRLSDDIVVLERDSLGASEFWILPDGVPEDAWCATYSLPEQTVAHPCWSSDDTQILYNGSTTEYPSGGLWLLEADGSATTELVGRSGKIRGRPAPNRYQPTWRR